MVAGTLLYNDVRAAGKILWNSESGDSDGTGITMARNLCLDWRWLHPTAWCYWQVMDPSAGWACIQYDFNTLRAGAVRPSASRSPPRLSKRYRWTAWSCEPKPLPRALDTRPRQRSCVLSVNPR